ncbi:MAG TPA: NAD(P)-dependent oxidoreductase [Cytophagales bacterium]|nr:NAD(P)-dependent oxidoreductase [Cytophagales bacterium]
MKIFITGGAGFVGSALVKNLSENQAVSEITVYDNFSGQSNALLFGQHLRNVKFVKGDILDSRTLKKSMAGHDTVVHLAEVHNLTQPHHLEQVNHWGTAEVCYAIEGLGIKNLVHLSTTEVYPRTTGDETIENSYEASPSDAYGSSKLRGEDHIKRFINKAGYNVHIIRAASIYGYSPSLKFESYLNKIVLDAHYFNRIELFGTGFQYGSFVHIDNVVSAIVGLIQGKASSQIHNLADHSVSVIDLIDVLKEVYPDMEFIFASHHLTLPHMRVKSSTQVSPFAVNTNSLVEQIREIKGNFSI